MSAREPGAGGDTAENSNQNGCLRLCWDRGSGLASIVKMSARLAALGLAFTQMGCLVTESVAFPDEANVPPSIVSRVGAANPLDSIVRFNVDQATVLPDGGPLVPNELKFEVDVRDPNLTQRLLAKIFVDNVFALDGSMEKSGTMKRAFEFSVAGSLLMPEGSCHKIELLVSSAFDFGAATRTTVDRDDIATAVWWVRSTRSDVSVVVDMALCPHPP